MEEYRSTQQKGFTLIEAVMAVAVISVVMAMGIIGFQTVLPKVKANSGMDQVLTQLRSARERAISHRCEVQVEFIGNNQLRLTEIWFKGVPPAPVTVSFEGGGRYTVFGNVPDLPPPFNFGNLSPVYFGGVAGGPTIMKFTTNGAFINAGNTFVNGTVFLGIPGDSSTARAISILGATGRVREFHWNGSVWQE